MSLDRPPAWLAPLERLEAKLRSKPSVADATVVSVDPIQVQLDGKPSPVAPSPSTVVPVAVGDRVWVMHHGKTRLRIIGVIGARRFGESEIFESMAPGASTFHGIATVSGGIADLTVGVNMIREAGAQSVEIGQLNPALAPTVAVPLPGYYANGAVMAAITSDGAMSLRWADSGGNAGLFFTGRLPLR